MLSALLAAGMQPLAPPPGSSDPFDSCLGRLVGYSHNFHERLYEQGADM